MNKKKLLIVGAGGLGRMVLDIAQPSYKCYFADDSFVVGDKVCDADIIGKTVDIKKYVKRFDFFIVAIGDNKIRKKITDYCLSLGIKQATIISPLSYVSNWSSVGNGCLIMPFATIQNGASVGNNTIICSHVEIHHDSSVGNNCVIYPNTTIRTYAKLGDGVKCGSNVTIGNGAIVPDDSIVCDGSVL